MSKAEPLKIPMNVQFKDLDGETVSSEKKSVPDGGKALTLKHVLIVATTTDLPEDQKDATRIVDLRIKQFEVYNLLLASTGDTLELAPDHAMFLIPRVARAFGVIVSGPTLAYLNGKNPPTV